MYLILIFSNTFIRFKMNKYITIKNNFYLSTFSNIHLMIIPFKYLKNYLLFKRKIIKNV